MRRQHNDRETAVQPTAPAAGLRCVRKVRAVSALSLTLLTLLLRPWPVRADDEFSANIGSVFRARCAKCHGKEETEGNIDLHAIKSHKDLVAQPELIQQIIEAVDGFDMPPDSEPEFSDSDRAAFVKSLKKSLSLAIAGNDTARIPIHRLNRFQYNNVIRDLFALDRDVFALPERLMTRHTNYLSPVAQQMPDEVDVTCDALTPQTGMRDVETFPKDLQAEHGYDNQADRLTLPPLLLDSMLDLGVSILNSPDFNSQTVGIWNDYFAPPPADQDMRTVLRSRITRFSRLAFRGPVSEEAVERYSRHVETRLTEEEGSFTRAMKDVTAAILSSPKFLFRIWEASPKGEHAQFALASRLSFCLWGSGPDERLLKLAEAGKLTDADVMKQTIQQMLVDPRISRFLDSFPAQWMKLESILSAAPDRGMHRLYSIGRQPAGLQMVVEPLLIFDTVFLENRPLQELISPEWSWHNDFLHDWYTTDLKPPTIDEEQIAAENSKLFAQRNELLTELETLERDLERFNTDNRKRIRANRKADDGFANTAAVSPIAAWEFDGDLTDSIGDLDLKKHGDVKLDNGSVILKDGYLESPLISKSLPQRTMEIWLRVNDHQQRSVVAMALTNEYRTIYEAFALGENDAHHWSIFSNDSPLYPASGIEKTESSTELIHLVLTRDRSGFVKLYRNGRPYLAPNRFRSRDYRANDTRLMIGRLLIPRNPEVRMKVVVDRARLYDKAISAEQVRRLYEGPDFVSQDELLDAMSQDDRSAAEALVKKIAETRNALDGLPLPADAKSLAGAARKKFESEFVKKMNRRFRHVEASDRRYGGIITNAAVLTMTSAPTHTQPIARGVWLTEVVFNNPPPPPPNDIPTLDESVADKSLTVRERFARHRADTACAACHGRIDPLGFALENFDVVGRWRDQYQNNRTVDPSGTLLKSHEFKDVLEFKEALVEERSRFARGFIAHFARFFAGRELTAGDALEIDRLVAKTAGSDYRLKDIMQAVCLSRQFAAQGKHAGKP